jgi:hypothetical protein
MANSIPDLAGEPDPWAPLRFLLGEWDATGSGEPGEGKGTFTFGFDLGGSILVRRARTDYPAPPGGGAPFSHVDLLIVYRTPGKDGFQAIYFDEEGHVIHYRLSLPVEKSAVFESDPSQPGPRFRLAYEGRPDDILYTSFSIAMPGQDFSVYVEGPAARRA